MVVIAAAVGIKSDVSGATIIAAIISGIPGIIPRTIITNVSRAARKQKRQSQNKN